MARRKNYEVYKFIENDLRNNIDTPNVDIAAKFSMTCEHISKIKKEIRKKLGIKSYKERKKIRREQVRSEYITSLPKVDKEKEVRKDLKKSPTYKKLEKSLDKDDLAFYEAKYIQYMLDPSIETMTAQEKDALHDLIMQDIYIFEYRQEEKVAKSSGQRINRAKEIRDCEQKKLLCRESLNFERKQRLKNQNDQAITFSQLIKEFKDPNLRREIGDENIMLKFIAEKDFNSRLGKNIMSGKNNPYDLSICFRDGIVPSGLTNKFTKI